VSQKFCEQSRGDFLLGRIGRCSPEGRMAGMIVALHEYVDFLHRVEGEGHLWSTLLQATFMTELRA